MPVPTYQDEIELSNEEWYDNISHVMDVVMASLLDLNSAAKKED